MNLPAIIFPGVMGLTILHSLWQITLLWILLVTVLRLWINASSSIRYVLAISTFSLSLLATACTALYEWQLHNPGRETTAVHKSMEQTLKNAHVLVNQTLTP